DPQLELPFRWRGLGVPCRIRRPALLYPSLLDPSLLDPSLLRPREGDPPCRDDRGQRGESPEPQHAGAPFPKLLRPPTRPRPHTAHLPGPRPRLVELTAAAYISAGHAASRGPSRLGAPAGWRCHRAWAAQLLYGGIPERVRHLCELRRRTPRLRTRSGWHQLRRQPRVHHRRELYGRRVYRGNRDSRLRRVPPERRLPRQ